MIAGYVTYDELKIITGFNDYTLNTLIKTGMRAHQITPEGRTYKQSLFNLQEVEDWAKVHLFWKTEKEC